MPDAMEASYNQWTGRKTTSLRRPILDCGHRNRPDREVHFHIWCDRLSCSPKCADAEHDCSQFKGLKSGIEEEAVAPEATVEASGPTRVSWLPSDAIANLAAPTMTELNAGIPLSAYVASSTPMDPVIQEAYRQEVRRQGFTTYSIDGVTYHVDQPVRAMPPAPVCDPRQSNADFARDVVAFSRAYGLHGNASMLGVEPEGWIDPDAPDEPVMLGIDPALDGSACIVIARVDVDGQVHVAPLAPPVDAALEPAPTGDEVADFAEGVLGVEVDPWQRQMLNQLYADPPRDRSWWRRNPWRWTG